MKSLFTSLLLLSFSFAFAQAPRELKQDPKFQLEIDLPSQVLLPENYDASKKYPVVVFMPFTGGSGYDLFNGYAFQSNVRPSSGGMMQGEMIQVDLSYLIDSLQRMPTNKEVEAYMDKLMAAQEPPKAEESEEKSEGTDPMLAGLIEGLFGKNSKKDFIAMIPHEAGSTKDHSWEGFEACIHRYENRILKDLEELGAQYSFDKDRVVLIGFSLGGDLSWAISQRYPEKFKGAIVMGSRCGYAEKGMLARQAKSNFKSYIGIGEFEKEVRLKGSKYAQTLLNKEGVANKLQIIKGEEHSPVTFDQLKEAFNFVLFDN